MSGHSIVPGDRFVPWLRQCRANWRFKPIKYLCALNARILPESTDPDTEIFYIDIGSVNSDGKWTVSEPIAFKESPSRARRVLVDGDVLISTVRTYLRAITYVGNINGNLICSTGFAVLSAGRGVDPKFLAYWVRSAFFVDEVVARSVGVSYPAINASDIGSLPFPLISLDEQCTIAAFLDREMERIDTLILKKERQIELLQEKRAALISHVVTKGLNPKAKMKDSGIEWLGEIPEHWIMTRFKYALWLQRGHDLPATDFRAGEYPVCGSNGCIGYHDHFTTKGPGVIVGRSGSVGEVNYIDRDYWAHNTALYVKEFRRIGPRYAFYLLKTLDVKYLSEGSAVGTLNRNYIHDLPVAIPSMSEQYAIVGFLDRETVQLQELIEKITTSIQALSEYRTALISAAVTGKIDVRKEVFNARTAH